MENVFTEHLLKKKHYNGAAYTQIHKTDGISALKL